MEIKKKGLICMAFLGMLVISCNKEEDCEEKKKDSCVVTFEINRVCGCNGVTYENPSTAECSSISNYTIGACK